MKKESTRKSLKRVDVDFFEKSWGQSWTYIKTVVDVLREPMLILNKDLCVMAANESFYNTFKVKPEETLHHLLHELGNGQWDIPTLQDFLREILPKKTFFKGFEVAHDFPLIGRRVIIMNGRQIYLKEETSTPIILLAMEDVTEMIAVAEKMSGHINKFEVNITKQTTKMETTILELQRQIEELKRK